MKDNHVPWLWDVHPLTNREISILIGLLSIKINESESGNDWKETPYSQDLKLIVEKLEDIKNA